MSDADVDYFRRRADAEFARAQYATSPDAARVHFALASAYADRIIVREPDRQAGHA